MLSDAEKSARIYAGLKGFSKQKIDNILKHYGSFNNFYDSNRELTLDKNYVDFRSITTKNNYISYGDSDYPQLLSETLYPPLIMFYIGNVKLLKEKKLISIVGTRKCTAYGVEVTKKIVENLSRHNRTFVSGMAMGIDTVVHENAIKNGAKTIAVLPSPLDNPAPRTNYILFKEICKKGLVVSEMPTELGWGKFIYAKRNRIIAGLSETTIVTEAPRKSGAIITANLAFEYNRNVYAVPGNINSYTSAGANILIKQNKAELLADIDELSPTQSRIMLSSRGLNFSNNQDKEIFKLLTAQAMSFDELLIFLDIKPDNLRNALFELELSGEICLNEFGQYNMKSQK